MSTVEILHISFKRFQVFEIFGSVTRYDTRVLHDLHKNNGETQEKTVYFLKVRSQSMINQSNVEQQNAEEIRKTCLQP